MGEFTYFFGIGGCTSMDRKHMALVFVSPNISGTSIEGTHLYKLYVRLM